MPGTGASGPDRIRLYALAAALAGALLYAGTVANGFVYDDISIVAGNPLTRDATDLSGIFGSHYWAPHHEGGNLYRPVTIWSFALNRAVTGDGAAGFHAVNALLHGLVSGLVVLLASSLGLGAGGALAAGLLFGFHPVHVEAVAPVVGRSELLAALFVLSGWLLHRAAGSEGPGRAWLLRVLAAAAFVLGLLSKEHAAVLPVLILAGELIPGRGRGWRVAMPTVVTMAVAGAAVFFLRSQAVPGLPPGDPLGSVFGGIDPITRILTATGVLGRYLWLLAFPLRLSADYSFNQIPLIRSVADPLLILSGLAHLALLGAGVLLAARRRLSGLGILTYLFALFPVSNLPLSVGTVMGERLLYLPSVGLCLLAPALFGEAAGGLKPSPAWRRVAAGALVAVCALYGARVIVRNAEWKDQHTLFTATVRTSPNSAKAWYNLGTAQSEAGKTAAALGAYRRAVEIKPDMTEAHRNLGLDLLREERPEEALPHLLQAAALDPELPDLLGDLGIAHFQLGQMREAEEAFRRELARRPGSPRGWYNLGTLLLETGRIDEAIDPLIKAAALAPDDGDAPIQLGLALTRLGRYPEALAALERAGSQAPGLGEACLSLARAAELAGEAGVASRARALARALAP